MREYWTRRRQAVWSLFELPDAEAWTVEIRSAYDTLLGFVDKLGQDSSPFAGILEAPN